MKLNLWDYGAKELRNKFKYGANVVVVNDDLRCAVDYYD